MKHEWMVCKEMSCRMNGWSLRLLVGHVIFSTKAEAADWIKNKAIAERFDSYYTIVPFYRVPGKREATE